MLPLTQIHSLFHFLFVFSSSFFIFLLSFLVNNNNNKNKKGKKLGYDIYVESNRGEQKNQKSN